VAYPGVLSQAPGRATIRIALISHASVVIETADAVIWSDPWLSGTAFNDSWGLLPEPPPGLADAWLPRVTHLYISHEHPDHFHVPSLRALPEPFRRRVVLVFQELHTDRMTAAFRRLGFANVLTLRHRERRQIAPETTLYLYQAAPLDSALAVIGDRTVLNVNDAELCPYDLRTIRADLGKIDTVLNQFSFATYDGREDYPRVARAEARRVLESVAGDHVALGARQTIPFASLMYFCAEDNRHLNPYGNRMRDVHAALAERGLGVLVLRPGDVCDLGAPWSNEAPLAYYDALDPATRPVRPASPVAVDALLEAGNALLRDLHRCHHGALLRAVGTFVIHVPDLGETLEMDVGRRRLRRLEGARPDWDIRVNSQPLRFAFETTYGMQTLSISGRFWLRKKHRRFMLLRVLAALRNAEIYLRPRHLLEPAFRRFAWRSRTRLRHQVLGWLGILGTFVPGSRPDARRGAEDAPQP
jgi:hypothetical protein